MATHYEVLGIAPTAAQEDVRRAYLTLARELHPDRTLGASVAQAELASRRMQEVNEAWRVLREPASRAAYDRAIAGGRRPTRPAAATTAPSAPRHLADDDDDPDLDTPFRSAPAEPGDLGVVVVRALPWVAVLVILGAIFVFTAFAGNREEPAGPEELVGRCVATGSASAVVAVPCEGPNDGEVVLVVSRPSLCPDDASSLPLRDRYLCLQPFNDIPVFTPSTEAP